MSIFNYSNPWNFPSLGYGKEKGLNNASDIFKHLDNVGLETAQNSRNSCMKDDNGEDVEVSVEYRLKNKGKIIIEVPHAEDFLILQEELKEFKNFTFWSQHLILHTYKSLKSILLKSGFKNINIQYYQRYNFSNHLGWFLKRKPGGHNFYKEIISDSLNSSYCENLKKLGQTDTLIAIAE